MRRDVRLWAESIKAEKRGTVYCATLSKSKHGLTLTYWAVRILKGQVWGIKKAAIKREDGFNECSSDMYFAYGGGSWVMVWENKKGSYYTPCFPLMNKMERCENCPNLSAEPLFGDDEIHALCPETSRISDLPALGVIEFAKRIKQNPFLCEMVYKTPTVSHMWDCGTIYTMKPSKLKKVMVYLKRGLSLADSMGMVKYGTKENMERARISSSAYKKFSRWTADKDLCVEMAKYSIKHKRPMDRTYSSLYDDYLAMSAELGRDMSSRGVLFPRDLDAQHDNVCRMVRELREAIEATKRQRIADMYERKAKELAEKYSKSMDMQFDGLTISIPKTKQDLVRIGDKLHICVGVLGYDQRVARGESIIMTVNKDGEEVECCELSGNGASVIQLRGPHNLDSEYHESAKRLVNMFVARNMRARAQA